MGEITPLKTHTIKFIRIFIGVITITPLRAHVAVVWESFVPPAISLQIIPVDLWKYLGICIWQQFVGPVLYFRFKKTTPSPTFRWWVSSHLKNIRKIGSFPNDLGWKFRKSLVSTTLPSGLKELHGSLLQSRDERNVPQRRRVPTPNNAFVIREIPQNCHRFVLFNSPKMGNLMTPGLSTWKWWFGRWISFCRGVLRFHVNLLGCINLFSVGKKKHGNLLGQLKHSHLRPAHPKHTHSTIDSDTFEADQNSSFPLKKASPKMNLCFCASLLEANPNTKWWNQQFYQKRKKHLKNSSGPPNSLNNNKKLWHKSSSLAFLFRFFPFSLRVIPHP